MTVPKVAVVGDKSLKPVAKLVVVLDESGFWQALQKQRDDRAQADVKVVIKPELDGFEAGSPLVTDPMLVEGLIDLLHDRGYSNVSVVGAADRSSVWASNRDVYARADLLGYRFLTVKDRLYDVIDLVEDIDFSVFPLGSALHATGLSRLWVDADFRIVFSKNCTDEEAGYALGLDSLIGVLPLADKSLHYRRRREPEDVVADLMAVAPVHFALIDAVISSHGAGGRRSPEPIDTGTIIASGDMVLADYIGALKMGLDPFVSPVFHGVSKRYPLPARYTVKGSLSVYPEWRNVPPLLIRSARGRGDAETLDRVFEPWLQCLDPELFPLKNPVDAWTNAHFAPFFSDTETSPTSRSFLLLLNALMAGIGHAFEIWRTLYDKDALRQRAVPLGIDTAEYPEAAYCQLVDELIQLEPIVASAPEASRDLRWRYVDNAVIFSYMRTLSIDFDRFVSRVDIARAIQFMNDYLGGVVVPVSWDETGRPVRQMERNLYLPQPNYLVLFQGKPIDVTKLEVVDYRPNRHRLFWKTIRSENGSATYDDGIASFERTTFGTTVTIMGRQKFTLPVFWQIFDLNLVPDIKEKLVTHAYRTFFDRTLANFEALVEGRDIRIGRSIDEPAAGASDQLISMARRIGEIIKPLLRKGVVQGAASVDHGHPPEVDADGFVHFRLGSNLHPATGAAEEVEVYGEIGRFIIGLIEAVQRDIAQQSHAG